MSELVNAPRGKRGPQAPRRRERMAKREAEMRESWRGRVQGRRWLKNEETGEINRDER